MRAGSMRSGGTGCSEHRGLGSGTLGFCGARVDKDTKTRVVARAEVSSVHILRTWPGGLLACTCLHAPALAGRGSASFQRATSCCRNLLGFQAACRNTRSAGVSLVLQPHSCRRTAAVRPVSYSARTWSNSNIPCFTPLVIQCVRIRPRET